MDLLNDALCDGVAMYSLGIGTFHSAASIKKHSGLQLSSQLRGFTYPTILVVFVELVHLQVALYSR